jgi:hypothetical protein
LGELVDGSYHPSQNVSVTDIGMDDAVDESLNEATVAALQDIDGNIKVDGLVLESHKTILRISNSRVPKTRGTHNHD